MLRNLLTLFLLLFAGQVILAQGNDHCSTVLSYENKNQVDPKPLRVSFVSGTVEDEQGVFVPDACLGIFTEDGQKLVVQGTSDENGKFAFKSLPAGKYRLVAKFNPFCAANIPIEVTKNPKARRKQKEIVIYMKPSGIDSCSHGDYK